MFCHGSSKGNISKIHISINFIQFAMYTPTINMFPKCTIKFNSIKLLANNTILFINVRICCM